MAGEPHSKEGLAGSRDPGGGRRGQSTADAWCVHVGTIGYKAAFDVQKRVEAARRTGEVPDVLLLLEHPPVYTRGRRSTPGEVRMGQDWYRSRGIEIIDTDRGGRITYHGPGQLVGYPIMSLHPYGDDVHDYIRRMERLIVASLAVCGVDASPVEGLTGVWTRDRRKIASIGVHVSRGVATHGFAINVNNDLEPFEWIVPCGIEHCRVSSVARDTGREHDMGEVMDTVCRQFGVAYERSPVVVGVQELAERTDGLRALAPVAA